MSEQAQRLMSHPLAFVPVTNGKRDRRKNAFPAKSTAIAATKPNPSRQPAAASLQPHMPPPAAANPAVSRLAVNATVSRKARVIITSMTEAHHIPHVPDHRPPTAATDDCALRRTLAGKRSRTLAATLVLAFALVSFLALALTGCAGSSEQTSGATFTPATSITPAVFDEDAASGDNGALVDTSHADEGYIGISASATSRLKAQVTSGQSTSNFDLLQGGSPTICPLVHGSGTYTVRVMQNTSGNNYVELYSSTFDVSLVSETAPFLVPNVVCNYNDDSACVTKARELVADAQTQGDAVKAICEWIVDDISYDNAKASQLKDATGYIPDPDSTLSAGTGICFDYASLGAAMLRSQGIPTKIVTGYVSPSSIYHAWIMVYIDGTWTGAQFSVSRNTWSRVDLTFASSGESANVGDGKSYTDRFVY